jgi:hypothetical protein
VHLRDLEHANVAGFDRFVGTVRDHGGWRGS